MQNPFLWKQEIVSCSDSESVLPLLVGSASPWKRLGTSCVIVLVPFHIVCLGSSVSKGKKQLCVCAASSEVPLENEVLFRRVSLNSSSTGPNQEVKEDPPSSSHLKMKQLNLDYLWDRKLQASVYFFLSPDSDLLYWSDEKCLSFSTELS